VLEPLRVTVLPSFATVPCVVAVCPFGPVVVLLRVTVLPSLVTAPWLVVDLPFGPVVAPE